MPEVIENKRSGLLVPVDNVSELTKGIERLLFEPDLKAKIAKNAKKRVETIFSISKMVDEYENLYAKMIE